MDEPQNLLKMEATPIASSMQQGAPPQQPAAPPTLSPSHDQVVAGLYHFRSLEDQLKGLIANPKFGKANIRPEVLDSMVKLIAGQSMKPTEAVNTLSDFPEAPGLQVKWVATHLKGVQQAREMMLQHRQQAAMKEDPNVPVQSAWSPDTHGEHMAGLLSHYKPGAQ
jgi:hypothetical protein